ncbi:hypothetical protein CLOM_g2306 [Closterium sp. NIES-68]|nr:hypothetical protein CLOM_g2306 [Closterium sp. NIES-68]
MAAGHVFGGWGEEEGKTAEEFGGKEGEGWTKKQQLEQGREQQPPRPRLERKAALSFRTRMQLERQQEQRESQAAEEAAAAAADAAFDAACQLDSDELALLSRLHADQSEEISIQGLASGSGILRIVRPGADPGPEVWEGRQGGRRAEAEARQGFVEEEQEMVDGKGNANEEDEDEEEEKRESLARERESLEALALEMLDGWEDDVVGGDALMRCTTAAFPAQSASLHFSRDLLGQCLPLGREVGS